MTISLENYLKDPCGSLSLPWWKGKNLQLPPDILVLHERDFDQAMLAHYKDDPYFRLRHALADIPHRPLPGFE